jgi:dethiobiotin synthetase
LSAEAIAARGLHLVGWVANHIDPNMLFAAENIEAIRLRLDSQYNAPLLGVIPRLAPPDALTATTYINTSLLLDTLRSADPGQ